MTAVASGQELPNVLGSPPAKTKEEWVGIQRPKTLENFRKPIYGRNLVERLDDLSLEVIQEDAGAMDGAATLKLVRTSYGGSG